jgi:iron complex outermembrane receptor protein
MKKLHIGEFFVALATVSSISAEPAKIESLEESSVVGDQSDHISSINNALELRETIAGGSSVVDVRQLAGQVIRPEELFQLDPGVYARSTGTANDSRLSIRGSGIQRRYGSRGITLLVDGMPANDSDGSYYFRIFDPQSISYMETLRGGNGMRYGSSQLGGAIQIHQKNGISDPGTQLKLEYSSFETYRVHIESGGSQGEWDWYAGYSYADSDGYRDHQNWASHHFTANLGYHWNDENVTRFYTLFSDSDALLSGGITPEEFKDDPTQASPGQHEDTDRDLSTFRLGQVTRWKTASGSWKFYTNYQTLDFDHLTGFGNYAYNNLVDYDTDTFQIGLSGSHEYSFAGLDHTLYTDFSADYGKNEVGGFSGFVTPFTSAGINDRDDISRNVKLYVENDTLIKEKHHFIAGLGYIWADRKREIGANDTNSTAFEHSTDGVIGKLGYLYELSDSSQIFTNLSRSFEAVPFSEVGSITDADPQIALTYEAGTRYKMDKFEAEFTAYLSKVSDEFVYEETAANSGVFNLTNQDTTHMGIEAALHTNLNDLFDLSTGIDYDLSLSYQFNDFTFDSGTAEGKQIPVISKHVITSQLRVSGEKWKTALTVDWLPDGLYADNLNTLKTSGYALTDLSFEYQLTNALTFNAGVNNLFDKQYASSVTVNPDAGSGYISPGDGRSIYTGFTYTW